MLIDILRILAGCSTSHFYSLSSRCLWLANSLENKTFERSQAQFVMHWVHFSIEYPLIFAVTHWKIIFSSHQKLRKLSLMF